jgi:hypothetical protein
MRRVRCLARDALDVTPARRGWPCGELEIRRGNAKGACSWGVTYNGSDRRYCLYGPRGRTRVSVYKGLRGQLA